MSHLTNLATLRVYRSRVLGPMPASLSNLTALEELDLSHNNLTSMLPVCQLCRLVNLNLGSNDLEAIPECLSSLARLSEVQLDDNRISGAIPRGLGLLQNLTSLVLTSNRFTGAIPAEIGQLAKLVYLFLADNRLTGELPPQLSNLSHLTALVLTNNQLSGAIPADLAKMSELQYLFLGGNRLTGAIPPQLSNLSNLTSLQLFSNQLSGPVPMELASMPKLKFLGLGSNNLSGPIPPELGGLSSLQELNLSSNQLSGEIPSRFRELSNMFRLDLSHNRLQGPLSPKANLTYLLWLDLSHNRLQGPLFSPIGAGSFLTVLDVSHNNLSGCAQLGPFGSPLYVDFSNNGPLAMLPGSNFGNLQVAGLPNLTTKDPPLIAPYLRTLRLSRGASNQVLDLSLVPATCSYVTYAGGPVSEFVFWDACTSSTGCLVNLVGTGSALSRHTRKEVCLGRIAVFLEGDPPTMQDIDITSWYNPNQASYLRNNQGKYYLNDTSFIDKIRLGPGGMAYTGVGFARVQEGNLCGNPEARTVVGVTFGVFAGLLLLSSLGWCIAARRGWEKGDSRNPVVIWGLYAWGIVSGLLPWLDLVTDAVVVADIWGGWSAWVVLSAILAPHLVSAACIARVWWAGFDTDAFWKVRNTISVASDSIPFLTVYRPITGCCSSVRLLLIFEFQTLFCAWPRLWNMVQMPAACCHVLG
jgi:Leucine-rich repeat (LRR) protein